MTTRPSDVLVVGAGPAGLAAAIQCAAHGLVTRVVARSPHGPNHALPLQSLHPRVELLLHGLDSMAALDGATVSRFSGISTGAHEAALSPCPDMPLFGFHVDRARFDALLLARAIALGVKMDGHDIVNGVLEEHGRFAGVSTRSGRHWRARWCIDASGYARAVGTRLCAGSRACSAPLTVVSGVIAVPDRQHGATRFVPHAEGWHWFTSSTDGHLTWTALQARSGSRQPDTTALIARSVPGSVQRADGSWRLTRPLASRGVLIAGDAAGRLDPAAGRGVVDALESGQMAAQAVIDSCLDPGLAAFFQADYDAWFVERFEANAQSLRDFYQLHGIGLPRHIRM